MNGVVHLLVYIDLPHHSVLTLLKNNNLNKKGEKYMLYLVEQYGDMFFVIKKISGYKPPTINGTKITEEEYKKLFNSNVNDKTRMRGVGNFCRRNTLGVGEIDNPNTFFGEVFFAGFCSFIPSSIAPFSGFSFLLLIITQI